MEKVLFLSIKTAEKFTEDEVKKYFLDRQDIWKSICCSREDNALQSYLKNIDKILVVRNSIQIDKGFTITLVVKNEKYFATKSQLDILLISILNHFKFTRAEIVTKNYTSVIEAQVDKTCMIFEIM